MKKPYLLVFVISICTMLLSSCLKDTIDELSSIKGVKASPSFSAPLINLSVGMKEIYQSYSQNAITREDPDGLIVFVFQTKQTVKPDQYVSIPAAPPFDFDLQMTLPMIALFEATGGFDLPLSDSLQLPTTNGEEISLINVKNGLFSLSFVNEFKHDIVVTVNYPTIKKNGVSISEVINMPYDPNNSPKTVTREINLKDYDIDFTNNGVSHNTLPFSYQISMTRIPTNSTSTSEKFNVTQNFQIESYNIIKGYMGRFEILSTSEEQEMDLFGNSVAGQIFINDPKLSIKLYNTFGLPVTGRITNLRVIDQNNVPFPVVINPFQDTFSFAHPTNPGEVAVSEFKIDKTNSNIDDAINSKPKYIKFDMKFDANYREEKQANFLVDTAEFNVDFNSEVPFDLKIIDYVAVQKQKNNSFSSLPSTIQSVALDVKIENSLPFDLAAQMLFTRDSISPGGDTINVALDSLFTTELLIQGAAVDGNGLVIAPTTSIKSISLPLDRYKQIQAAPFNVLRMHANSSQFNGTPGFVKVYTNQKLNVKIGGDVKLTIKSN